MFRSSSCVQYGTGPLPLTGRTTIWLPSLSTLNLSDFPAMVCRKLNRLSFRHTIAGKSDRFRVDSDGNQIVVRPVKGNGPVPYWTHDELLNIAGGKIRRMVLVKGERTGRKVRYLQADCYENLHIGFFIYELVRGTIRIDFDVREAKPGSKGLRNHGTKFRVSPDDVCRLYTKKERLG